MPPMGSSIPSSILQPKGISLPPTKQLPVTREAMGK
ncbi:hypothetical protein CUMW_229790 [Citrus unshiu]|uniref:Uncharacterized protein n=1 Tax=Citrus unshiu TaxID=55188 RepID=A0A2H5QH57_CITUN|nr:hypothetical protein CUMW_229790 [Citrus unshiu]